VRWWAPISLASSVRLNGTKDYAVAVGDIRRNGNGSVTARIFDSPASPRGPRRWYVRGTCRLRSEPPAKSPLDSGRT
jgi:hypothetical protein